jgi:hypothetical protein
MNADRSKVITDTISYRHSLDYLDEGRGPYYENFVVNQQITANIRYNPIMVETRSSPTSQYPDRIQLLAKTSVTGSNSYANFGFGHTGSVGFDMGNTSTSSIVQYLFEDLGGPDHFQVYRVSATRTRPNVIATLSVVEVEFQTLYLSKYWQWRVRTTSYSDIGGVQGEVENFDIYEKTSISYLDNIISQSRSTVGAWQGGLNTAIWNCNNPFTMSKAAAELAMNSAIAWDLYPVNFPVESMHFGDLAMKAAEKVNRTNINMIAFLRDLRHPQELIPKLKELNTLKGLAGNYLSVEYGILPTISDLQSIVDAFKKVKPFLDRNGFSLYNAGHTGSTVIGDTTYTLEQHLKLAIANEDDALDYLCQSLDSWGLLPTFENVWDLIPYSFVIDWFVDVGGFLERIDTRLKLIQYNVRYVTMSQKTHASTILQGSALSPYVGTVARVRYHRWVSDQCPVPPLSLKPTFQDFNHWLESGALLLQRAK